MDIAGGIGLRRRVIVKTPQANQFGMACSNMHRADRKNHESSPCESAKHNRPFVVVLTRFDISTTHKQAG